MMRLLLILLFALSACHSGWDKDPFADDPDSIKNATPQGTKKKAEPPINSVVFIQMEQFYEAKEGRKLVIDLDYNITHPEFRVVDFVINDLEDDFPGAFYDAATKKITWTPAEDYVPSGAIVYRRPLTVSVFVEYKGLVKEVRKSASINVLRGDARAPSILKVEGLDDVKEGKRDYFEVFVKDEVSPQGPTLIVRNGFSTSNKNGSSFIYHDVRGIKDPKDPSLWVFEGRVDLTEVSEVTDEEELYSVGFQAFSAFGESSSTYSQSFRVLTSVEKPEFFLGEIPEFKVGVENTYSFIIVDRKKEGVVDAQFQTNCATLGARCSCEKDFYEAQCTITWKPESASSQVLQVKATNHVKTTNIDETQSQTKGILIKAVN